MLKAVFEGLTNKEIAANMQISESSVKAVLQQLFDKTGVSTRSQLVRIALEQHAGDWLAIRSMARALCGSQKRFPAVWCTKCPRI